MSQTISPAILVGDQSDAQGGAIVLPPEVHQPFIAGVNRDSGLTQLADVSMVNSPLARFPVYWGRPMFTRQGQQGGSKAVGSASFGTVMMHTQTYAAITAYSRQLIRDALADPTAIISGQLTEEVALLLEAEALGYLNGAPHDSGFGFQLCSLATAPNAVKWDPASGMVGLRDAVITARKNVRVQVGQRSYRANGVLFADDVQDLTQLEKQHMTVEDDSATVTNYWNSSVPQFAGGVADLAPGMSALSSINLPLAETAVSGDPVAVVGYWPSYKIRIREGIAQAISTEATVKDAEGNEINAFQDNAVLLRHEFDAGGGVIDPKAFCLVVRK